MSTLPPYKQTFLSAAVNGSVLRFGTFTLKSGRQSPYFFNAGDFHRADLLTSLASAFAHTIHTHTSAGELSFDVIFGPAYKGIPLATAATLELHRQWPELYSSIHYSFDRKEAKDHGEGGTIVGAPLKGKRVLIVDDVVTAGTAKREAVAKIEKEGGVVAGLVVAVDRMEKLPAADGDDTKPGPSAIGQLKKEFGIPIFAILTLDDIVDGVAGIVSEEDLVRMKEYRAKYKASD